MGYVLFLTVIVRLIVHMLKNVIITKGLNIKGHITTH